MKMRKWVLCLAVTILATGETASAAKPVIVVRGGAETPTREYVWSVMAHNLRGDHGNQSRKAQVRKMSAANIYRKLMAGKINVASVLLEPDEADVGKFAAWRKKNKPTVCTLGHAGVYVIVPGNRKIKQLSLQQIKDTLAGKITTWKQLGGIGEGNIRLVADETALYLHHALTGEKPKARIRKYSMPIMVASFCSIVARTNRQKALVQLAKEMRKRAEAGERPPKPRPKPTPIGDDALGLTVCRKMLHWSLKQGKEGPSIIPLHKGKEKPIAPSVTTIRDRTYPLSFTWRIYAHPRASELVLGCVKACVGAHEGNLQNAHYVKRWLLPANRVAAPGTIRIMVNWRWDGALKAAAKNYRKSHPGVNVRFAKVRHDFGKRFQTGDVDILAYSAPYPHFGGQMIKTELRKLYGPTLPEQTIGYRGLVAVAVPENPIKSLTWKQVRRVVSHDLTPWTFLGGNSKGWVHKYYRSSSAIRECLFGGKMYKRISIDQTLKRPGRGKLKELLAQAKKDHNLYKQVCRRIRTQADLLDALADDSNGIGLLLYSRRVHASGLKILKLGGPKGGKPVAPTPATIANGTYPARLPMKLLIHPKASRASRDFVKWLSSEQAGRVMKDYYVFNSTVARGKSVVSTDAATPKETPALLFDKPISGTVAVMPGETLSRYFVIAKPQHHAAYERLITEALGRDKRLKIVNRVELNRVWVERGLALTKTEKAPTKPILVADIFVLPRIVSEKNTAVLRIQAVHGATGSVLGELRLAIDPTNPTGFTPSLSSRVQRWWPGVLERLWLAKHKSVWSLVDIYSGKMEVSETTAETVHIQLRKKLRQDKKRFLADYAPMEATYREVLMRLMGLSRSWKGRFSPAADYLIEGRLTSAKRLELRILSAGGKRILAQAAIEANTPNVLVGKAWTWLDAKAANLPAKTGGSDTVLEDWSKPQSRLEFRKGESVSKRVKQFFKEAEQRRMKTGSPDLLPADKKKLNQLNAHAKCHYLRAAQLDPTWENAAYKIMRMSSMETFDISKHFIRTVMLAEAYTRFTETFQKSKRGRGVMEHVYVHWRNLAGHLRTAAWHGRGAKGLPRGVNYRKLYLRYLRKSLDVRHVYFKRYMHRHKTFHGGRWHSIQCMTSHYFYDTTLYLAISKASDAQIRQAVADYEKLLGKYPAETVHSDFLKLQMIAWRNDKAGFLKMLRAMQKRYPNPKNVYWQRGADVAAKELRRLFKVYSGAKNTFRQWRKGKRGAGDLPHVGYDPDKDKHAPTARPWN